MKSRRLEGVAWRLPAEDGRSVPTARPSRADAPSHPLDAVRPGLARKVAPGDLLVIDGRFGLAFREAAAVEALTALGTAAVVAREFDPKFAASAATAGLLLLVNAEAAMLLSEGNRTRVDVETGLVHDLTTGDWHRPEPASETVPDESSFSAEADPLAFGAPRFPLGSENREGAR